jgi:hypothetical protein
MPMTAEQKQLAITLRSDGMPYLKIAAKIGVSESAAYTFLTGLTKPPPPEKPEPIPQQKPTLKRAYTPVHHHVASVPMRRHIDPEARKAPTLTREQMYYDLARAVRNTARLSIH